MPTWKTSEGPWRHIKATSTPASVWRSPALSLLDTFNKSYLLCGVEGRNEKQPCSIAKLVISCSQAVLPPNRPWCWILGRHTRQCRTALGWHNAIPQSLDRWVEYWYQHRCACLHRPVFPPLVVLCPRPRSLPIGIGVGSFDAPSIVPRLAVRVSKGKAICLFVWSSIVPVASYSCRDRLWCCGFGSWSSPAGVSVGPLDIPSPVRHPPTRVRGQKVAALVRIAQYGPRTSELPLNRSWC
jgi:hypothetical protein